MAPQQADEADFLELLIASERIDEWLDVIRTSETVDSHLMGVLGEMREAISSKEAYIEEGREAGTAAVLTRMLKRLDPEANDGAVIDEVARILALLSGPAAVGGGLRRVHIQRPNSADLSFVLWEGSLVDGVGARLWAAAHILCTAIARQPDLVQGRRVLELGAGCGACGLTAALAGAQEVVLTDYLDSVLRCTGASVALTLGEKDERQAGNANNHKPPPCCWEAGNVTVRHLDWTQDSDMEKTISNDKDPPSLSPSVGPFDVVLGADILYEAWMAEAVAAVIGRRLAPGGVAMISCAVRENAIFETFERELRNLGFVVQRQVMTPDPAFVGVMGHGQDYEGGFRLTLVQHAASPCNFLHPTQL